MIQYGPRWIYYLIGGCFILGGGGVIISFLTKKVLTKCIFDKGSGQMCLKRQSFINSQTIEHMLYEIKEARVIEGTNSDGYKTYDTKLILLSGEEISLDTASNHYQIAESINHFLGINKTS